GWPRRRRSDGSVASTSKGSKALASELRPIPRVAKARDAAPRQEERLDRAARLLLLPRVRRLRPALGLARAHVDVERLARFRGHELNEALDALLALLARRLDAEDARDLRALDLVDEERLEIDHLRPARRRHVAHAAHDDVGAAVPGDVARGHVLDVGR